MRPLPLRPPQRTPIGSHEVELANHYPLVLHSALWGKALQDGFKLSRRDYILVENIFTPNIFVP
jgi:hypothetical protein